MPDEREDLQNLVTHPGFLRLQRYQREYWTDQLVSHLQHAVGDRDDLLALQKMRQVIAAQRATEALLRWPEERLNTLQMKHAADHAEASVSRRGSL